jgi:hypothetical protein
MEALDVFHKIHAEWVGLSRIGLIRTPLNAW